MEWLDQKTGNGNFWLCCGHIVKFSNNNKNSPRLQSLLLFLKCNVQQQYPRPLKWLMLESQQYSNSSVKLSGPVYNLHGAPEMCLRHFWPFLKVARCSMEKINERKKIFTFYYTSSTFLKRLMRERRESNERTGLIQAKTQQNNITTESPDFWLFAIFLILLFFFFFLDGHLCWYIQHNWKACIWLTHTKLNF